MGTRIFFLMMVLIASANVPLLASDSEEGEVRAGAEDFMNKVSPLIYGSILESASPYGGFPHFSLGVGLNLMGEIKFRSPSDTTMEIAFPGVFPYFLCDIGLFKGVSVTPLLQGMGAVDILFRWTPIPDLEDPSVTKTPQFFSYGFRIGLLKDALTTPGLSFTWKTGKLSTLRVEPQDGSQDLEWAEISLRTHSFFIQVSKSLIFVTPYLGVGKDWYTLNTRYKEPNGEEKEIKPKIKNSSGRTVLGLRVQLLLVKLFAEFGKYGDNTLFTTGLRIGI